MGERKPSGGTIDTPGRFTLQRVIGLVLTIGIGFVLVQVAIDLPEEPSGLASNVAENIGDTGVSHPVTAVLLNFRAYDTFLEIGVLILAVLGILAVRREGDLRSSMRMAATPLYTDPVLTWLVRLLAPLLVLSGGYLLWLGTSAPGGAFQAGALLAAAGVALRMSGHPSVAVFQRTLLRSLILFGFLVFLLVAVATMVFQPNMLQFPEDSAGLIILVVELTLTISIAMVLIVLFVGAKPPYEETVDEEEAA
jgi:multisubunit Na+/H+ antiporter MnhB subunit